MNFIVEIFVSFGWYFSIFTIKSEVGLFVSLIVNDMTVFSIQVIHARLSHSTFGP